MQHCSTLNEYAQYVARVRHYATDMPLNHAVERAVDECIRKGILTEFLTRNSECRDGNCQTHAEIQQTFFGRYR